MSSFGREKLSQTSGRVIQVTSDGNPEHKTGGVTIDWTTVAPVTVVTTLPDDIVVPIGDSYLRYGQVITMITATGKYGPYDPAANDGRQLLARGNCFIINMTSLQTPSSGLGREASDYPQALEGGRMWKARILATIAGPHSLAAGPLFSELEGVLPRLRYTIDQ